MNSDYREVKVDFDFRNRDVILEADYMAGPEITVKLTFKNIDTHPSQLTVFLSLEQAEKLGKLLE